jgi:DUF4097 and DUF4098 domain-containing protein YvlB
MQQTFTTEGLVSINVENQFGLVVVTASDSQLTTVTIEADTGAAEELADNATVECRASAGRDKIRVKIPHTNGLKFLRRNGVSIHIETPIGADLDIKTASADVELNGSFGEVSVKSASGDVTADRVMGDMQVHTASSDLSVESVLGRLQFHTASGDMRSDRVEGGLVATTASGDIEVGSAYQRVEVRDTSGEIRLGDVLGDASIIGVSGDVRVLSCGAGRVQVRTVSGDVSVGIPQGTTFEIDAESKAGSVHSDIPLESSMGTSGAGPDVSISVRSVSGDVLVERAVGVLIS